MLNAITSSLPALAQRPLTPSARDKTAAPAPDRAAANRAADETPDRSFEQAMDKAQSPDSAQRQAARLRQARQAAADNGKVRGPADRLPPAQPPQAEGKDVTTLPPEAETEDARQAGGEGEPAALLAQLQAQAQAARGGRGAGGAGGAHGDGSARGALNNGDSAAQQAIDGADIAQRTLGAPRGAAPGHRAAAGHDSRSSHLGSAGDATGRSAAAAADSTQALQAHSEDRATTAAQLLALVPAGSGTRGATEAGPSTDALTLPASASVGTTAAPAPGSNPVAEAPLPASLDSPDFASHLATQLSTFVRDGIEHARLHLNPAEMGPVSVQIQLDGSMATVHLGAEQAQTRQALEEALPQLAGQLREAGLTLTGGGVFEQTPQGRDGTGTSPGDSRPAPGTPATWGRGDDRRTDDAASPLARLPQRRGVVDLVA